MTIMKMKVILFIILLEEMLVPRNQYSLDQTRGNAGSQEPAFSGSDSRKCWFPGTSIPWIKLEEMLVPRNLHPLDQTRGNAGSQEPAFSGSDSRKCWFPGTSIQQANPRIKRRRRIAGSRNQIRWFPRTGESGSLIQHR